MNYQEGGKVIFNEGVAITFRLDDIQKQITHCSLNPGAFNPRYNEYNYRLWLRFLTALQREISADLKKSKNKKTKEKEQTEEGKAEDMRLAIINFEKRHPVYTHVKLKVPPYSTKLKKDERALNIIVEKLNEYGTYLMELKKLKGYGNPTSDDPAVAMSG